MAHYTDSTAVLDASHIVFCATQQKHDTKYNLALIGRWRVPLDTMWSGNKAFVV